MRFDRTDTTVFGRWWWTVDRLNLLALLLLIAVGSVLIAAGSPPVARRLDLPPFYFVHHQEAFLAIGLILMLAVSLLPAIAIRRIAVIGFAGSLVLMVLVLFLGTRTKGAHRWIDLFGISLQPSEFMKPCFAIVMAWVCAENQRRVDFPGYRIGIALFLFSALLLVLEPDIGMTLTITAMWGIQVFLAGLPLFWVSVIVLMSMAGLLGAYHIFPHVAMRINSFLAPTAGNDYQVGRSLEAFRNGGLFGRGPGEGQVKQFLPDSHTDFIFAVAGEEFGAIACLLIVALFAFVVLRGLSRVYKETDLFAVLAVAGLLTQFGIQAIINMGVDVDLFPAKGMTLPFISYGGSSVIAMAIGMGMMLALTRKRYGAARE